MLDEQFWQGEREALYQILVRAVSQSATDGAQAALSSLLTDYGLGVDWATVNAEVQQWARQHAAELVKDITQTSQKAIQEAIADWQASGAPLSALIDTLTPMFGETRAELIASTEVTRAFASGNQATWKASGVVEQMRWMTAQDELVCPICGPLAGTTMPLDSTDIPPAHPRCRCWVHPVVSKP